MVFQCEREASPIWSFAPYGNDKPSLLLNQKPGQGLPAARSDNASLWLDTSQGSIDCTDFIGMAKTLSGSRYYPSFRNALSQGGGRHYDLQVGVDFVTQWNQWKNGGNKVQADAIQRVTEDIRRVFAFSSLEINASASLQTLSLIIDRKSYLLNEVGSGVAQFVITLANTCIDRPTLILIDEPESNLHPSLQTDFLLTLGNYAQEGVIFSTHSLGLARSVADHIYSVRRQNGTAVVQPFEATAGYSEFVGELSFAAFRDLGFERLLLVEGVHDVRVMQQLLRLVDKDHKVVVLPLGGNQLAAGGREVELAELLRISQRISALVDSERSNLHSAPKPERMKFAETCRRLGIDVCLTQFRAIENYFTQDAVTRAMGSNLSALGPFEAGPAWGKVNNWKIARHIHFSDIEHTDIGEFLKRL